MLVLSRKVGEELVIGENIRIVVSRVAGNRVSLGIQAPADVRVMRSELKKIRDEFSQKAGSPSIDPDLAAVLALSRNPVPVMG